MQHAWCTKLIIGVKPHGKYIGIRPIVACTAQNSMTNYATNFQNIITQTRLSGDWILNLKKNIFKTLHGLTLSYNARGQRKHLMATISHHNDKPTWSSGMCLSAFQQVWRFCMLSSSIRLFSSSISRCKFSESTLSFSIILRFHNII